ALILDDQHRARRGRRHSDHHMGAGPGTHPPDVSGPAGRRSIGPWSHHPRPWTFGPIYGGHGSGDNRAFRGSLLDPTGRGIDRRAPRVFIVDDDASVRKALGRLVRSAGYEVEVFSGAAEYLARSAPERPACLVVDIRMPGMTGLELQQAIDGTRMSLPV